MLHYTTFVARCCKKFDDNDLFDLNDLFDKLSEIPGLNLNDISCEELCEVLLFGNSNYNQIASTLIVANTIKFILSTKRLT